MGKFVVHRRQKHDVYIGRPSIWGNPFVIGQDGTRFAVITKYKEWLLNHEDRFHLIVKAQKELRGKVLGCFCAPDACHGDVLAEVANALCFVCKSKDCPHLLRDGQWSCSGCLSLLSD
jgi:hypothetical protein